VQIVVQNQRAGRKPGAGLDAALDVALPELAGFGILRVVWAELGLSDDE
jgi:hypothetical protein